MHRTAFAADASAFFAVKLSQNALGRHAFDHRLDVVAIGRDDHIGRFESHHRTDADGFLADVEMAKTADLAHAVNLGTFFLKTAAENHLIEHLTQKFLVRFLDQMRAVRHAGRYTRPWPVRPRQNL